MWTSGSSDASGEQVGSQHSSGAGKAGKIVAVWLELALNEKGQAQRDAHQSVWGRGMTVVSPLSSHKSNGKVKGMEKKLQMGNQLWWTWASRAFPTHLNVSSRNWNRAEAGEETLQVPRSLKESSGQPSVSLAEKRGPCKGSNFRLASEGITLTLAPAGLPNILIFFSTAEHKTDLLNSWGANRTQACLNWPFTLQHAGEHGLSEVLLGLPALELFRSCWRAASLQVF